MDFISVHGIDHPGRKWQGPDAVPKNNEKALRERYDSMDRYFIDQIEYWDYPSRKNNLQRDKLCINASLE